MIDHVRGKVEVPAQLASREMQAELLANCVLGLGMVLSAAGMTGVQITFEVVANEVTVMMVPSSAPGDAEILREIGAKVKSGGILQPDGAKRHMEALH